MRLSTIISAAILAVFAGVASAAAAEKPKKASNPKTALLIIDVQQFYFANGAMPLHEATKASGNVARLLTKFREDKRPIIHVGHNAKNQAEFHRDAAPRNGEKVIMKDEVSAFMGTNLAKYLKKNRIKRLVICGMQTHMCLEAAVRAAHDLGLECVVAHDACATRDLTFNGQTIAAKEVHLATLATLDRTYATVVDTCTALKML